MTDITPDRDNKDLCFYKIVKVSLRDKINNQFRTMIFLIKNIK